MQNTAMMNRANLRDLVAVMVSVALLGLGWGGTMPLTALTLASKGYGADVVGWMTAAMALGGVIGTIASPWANERFGRRFVMLGCLILASASTILIQYTDALAIWFAMRTLFGAALAPLFVLGESWIVSLSTDATRNRVIAIYTTSYTVFQVLGPLLTDWLLQFDRYSFVMCGCLFLVGAPGILLARDDRSVHPVDALQDIQSDKQQHATWLDILRIAPGIIAGTAFFAAFDNVILSFLPLTLLDAGFDQRRALAAASLVLAGDAALQFPLGWLAARYGRSKVQLLCGIAVCLMLPLISLTPHLPLIWPLYLFALGGAAGALYTLSMAASGEYFSGSALVRASGLIGLTWNFSSSAGSALTGLTIQGLGSSAMPLVLWLLAVIFVAVQAKQSRGLTVKVGL
jgi:MFS family permease